MPITLGSQSALTISVSFQSADAGNHSATLRSDGVSIILIATVLPRLTLTGSFDFGSVVRGSSAQLIFTISNQTQQTIIAPGISVGTGDFAVSGNSPSGQTLAPQQSATFAIVFTPRSTGALQATLTFGDRSYTLTGIGVDPLPKPFVTVALKQVASAQQGTATVRFDAPAKTSGTGSLTLEFRGAADPTVAFASGGRSVTFNIAPGDTQASVAFQTGTTAGTLVFTAQLGGATDQLSVVIPNAPAGVAGTQGQRAQSSVQVDVTGFDNTRTLGALSFTFYDSTGNVLPSGTVQANGAADFSRYFGGSDLGGAFVMRAVFPVTGDTSRIAACDVTLTNSAGSTRAPRILF